MIKGSEQMFYKTRQAVKIHYQGHTHLVRISLSNKPQVTMRGKNVNDQ